MEGRKITAINVVEFSIKNFGLYAITIKARCQSGKLFGFWGGENLRVEIDNIKPREVPAIDKPQYTDIPSAWNGTVLKGLAKTTVFILSLNKGNHRLTFVPTRGAIVEKYFIEEVRNPREIVFDLNEVAEEGDRRPWYTFALINLPLENVTFDVTVDWHIFDGDDVKLIIDGRIEQNAESKLWHNWIWHSSPRQILSGPKKEEKRFVKKLDQGVHYLELWADKTPILHKVQLTLGEYRLKGVPTVEDPEWTGDFDDDPDRIILARVLFGEARNTRVPDEARLAIGWVIKNRVSSNKWPNTYWEVITEPLQFSSFNLGDENRPYVENPLHSGKKIDQSAWKHTYEIAGKILNGELPDPTKGANHYHDDSRSAPDWAAGREPVHTVSYLGNAGRKKSIFFYKL